ncbi:hypothetical protein PO909_028485 [Leuciscus waleckii]
MAEDTILQVVCGNHGAMDYERLLDISFGLTEISPQNSLDKILRESGAFTVIQRDESKEVFAQANVKLCRRRECDELSCGDLHMCKYELMTGRCTRHGCSFGHQQLRSEHNMRILGAHHMTRLSREHLRVLLLQSDSGLLPPVCAMFNRGRGPDGLCPDREKCTRLHVCEDFIRGRCGHTDCTRTHDFHEPRVRRVLFSRGVSHQLMDNLPFIYRNILTLKTREERGNMTESARTHRIRPETNTENEICLSFLVRSFCRDDECSKTHFKMPYKWEVKVGRTWHDLPNSQQIERDYCDPYNIHSSGNEPICFEEMTLGLDEVRRLSTKSSALLPDVMPLTTSWIWYWKDEYNRWIQYASIAEMHRLSSVSSEMLEQRYQEYLQLNQEDSGIKFTAGNRFYELSLTDMKQRNEASGTERPVRRRPAFVSSVDVQKAKARGCSASKTQFSKGVPGFWDHTAIPKSGFQRVRLPPSHRDYVRVQKRFNETLRGFTVQQIERVQNRELWENFMTKKEQMKIANNEKYREWLLFHGTRSSLVDGVCHRNCDFQEVDAAAYGKGIYFSKDARYWDERTDGFAVRRVFACRVLVGYYTRGAARFHQPPAKRAEGSLYDSCVDDPRDPSIFVVFDRSQIYPEFLITYEEENRIFEVVWSGFDTFDVSLAAGIAQVNTKETKQTSKATEPEQTSVIIDSGSASSLKGPNSEHTSFSGGTDSQMTVLSSTLDATVGVTTVPALPVSAERAFTALPVSAERASTALPVLAERASTALPVLAERASTALPVSAERASTALPVSAERASTALPVLAEHASTALPVSAERASTALPVLAERASTALPVLAERASTALPVLAERASTALPVSAERASTALPVLAERASTALPVLAERASTALPVSAERASTALPVSAERASTALPVSAERASTALPVLAERASTALPVSAERASTALPVSAERASTALPVLAEHASTALPVSAERASIALPVSNECTSIALPVSDKRLFTALPVSAESASPALPVSAALTVLNECTSIALPVSAALPVSDAPRTPLHPALTAQRAESSLCHQMSVIDESSLSMGSQSTVKYSVKNMPSLPAGVNRTTQSWSRSSESVSSSSTLSSHHSRLLPHDHTGSSSSGTNTHNPQAQKKKCVVM